MKKTGILLGIFMSCFVAASFAAGGSQAVANAKAAFKKKFPTVNFSSFEISPIANLYEVVAGDNIIYFNPDSGILVFGELWTPEGENLTQAAKDRLAQEKIKDLPLNKAIKIGSGPKVVIEVTDPDCPFCRKGSEYLDKYEKEITRYIFFYPLKQLHPQAEEKARYVLAAGNQVKAFWEVMSGKYDSEPLPDFVDNGDLEIHQEVAAKLQVKGTPAYWVDGTSVSGANIAALEKLLTKE